MTVILGLCIFLALVALMWRAAASCPLVQLLLRNFDSWADVSRSDLTSDRPPLS